MSVERLFKVLSDLYPLTDDFKKILEKTVIPLSLPKNHILQEAPKVADYVYFIDKGFAMSYSFIQGRKEVHHFWRDGQIILLAKSFFERTPAFQYVQLMQQSELWCITHDSVMNRLTAHEETNIIFRIIMNQYYAVAQDRIHDLQHLNAVQRYQKLIHAFPHIEQRVSAEYIASYLGMTPQSLSRAKREIGRH
ncbi:MAG TPA: Crp/Fnr family transcriptional regulator [Ohtaekwangia sp.]|nr:Crp/Fnr family transcriptional regulator [Ohtaekwangia sp.]